MNRRTYLLLLLIICLSIPLAVNVQVTELAIISGDGQTGRPGQTLNPFIVEARNQNGDPVSEELVGFIQDSGSLSNITVHDRHRRTRRTRSNDVDSAKASR